MSISLLRCVVGLAFGCTAVSACASNATVSAKEVVQWSMLLDSSTPSFDKQEEQLRARLTACSPGRAVIYHDSGMTAVSVNRPTATTCQWRLAYEREGENRVIVCSGRGNTVVPHLSFVESPTRPNLLPPACILVSPPEPPNRRTR